MKPLGNDIKTLRPPGFVDDKGGAIKYNSSAPGEHAQLPGFCHYFGGHFHLPGMRSMALPVLWFSCLSPIQCNRASLCFGNRQCWGCFAFFFHLLLPCTCPWPRHCQKGHRSHQMPITANAAARDRDGRIGQRAGLFVKMMGNFIAYEHSSQGKVP